MRQGTNNRKPWETSLTARLKSLVRPDCASQTVAHSCYQYRYTGLEWFVSHVYFMPYVSCNRHIHHRQFHGDVDLFIVLDGRLTLNSSRHLTPKSESLFCRRYSLCWCSLNLVGVHYIRFGIIARTGTHWEITQFPIRQLSGPRNHKAKDCIVPGAHVVVEFGIMQFLGGYGFLLLCYDPWEWESLRVGKLHISHMPFLHWFWHW